LVGLGRPDQFLDGYDILRELNDRPPKPVEMVGVLVFAQAIKKGIGITAKVLVCRHQNYRI